MCYSAELSRAYIQNVEGEHSITFLAGIFEKLDVQSDYNLSNRKTKKDRQRWYTSEATWCMRWRYSVDVSIELLFYIFLCSIMMFVCFVAGIHIVWLTLVCTPLLEKGCCPQHQGWGQTTLRHLRKTNVIWCARARVQVINIHTACQVAQKLIRVMQKNDRKARPKKKILTPCTNNSDDDDDLQIVYLYHPAGSFVCGYNWYACTQLIRTKPFW